MITKAINELQNHNLKFTLSIDKYTPADTTTIIGDTLYYKTIPEGLLALATQQQLNKQVDRVGIMYDVSRCAAFTVDGFKQEIRSLALLGYDYIMIYAEDMFELDVANFGYMRGKYSGAEIQEIVSYAQIFEIEVIPCIQSLGHYENFLKWDHEKKFTDTESVLNVESPDVDSLLDSLLGFCTENFKSKIIHIGMDEANDLGRGYYLRDNDYKPQAEIFINHLKKMYEKCIALNYEQIIIWSDMLFTLDNLGTELYDNQINLNILSNLQQMDKLKLCYWNYWSKTVSQHQELLKVHTNSFPTDSIICAGGVNQWGQLNYLIDSNISFDALLEAMTVENCKNLLLTIWGDGAAYTNFYTTKFGIFERAFKVYQLANNQQLFEQLFGFSQEPVQIVSAFSLNIPNAPRYLWENPLELSFSKCNPIDPEQFKSLIITADMPPQLEYTKQLVNFTIYKSLLAHEMLLGKQSNDYLQLALETYNKMYSLFREYWLSLYKIQGLGVAQGRFSLIQNRLLEIEYRKLNNIEFPEISEYSPVQLRDQFNDLFFSTNLRS